MNNLPRRLLLICVEGVLKLDVSIKFEETYTVHVWLPLLPASFSKKSVSAFSLTVCVKKQEALIKN